MPKETLYSAAWGPVPDLIQRGEDQVLRARIERGGSIVSPSATELTVYDGSGEAVVDAVAVSNDTDGIPAYTLTAATTTSLELSAFWTERWDLTIDGSAYRFVRPAQLVLQRLYPAITESDLLGVHTELRDWRANDQVDLQGYIDAAWDRIQLRLLQNGRRPSLVLSPGALFGVHLDLTLALIFRDYAASSSADGKYMALALDYQKRHDNGWGDLRFDYDIDEDGKTSTEEADMGGEPVLLTNVPGSWRWGLS